MILLVFECLNPRNMECSIDDTSSPQKSGAWRRVCLRARLYNASIIACAHTDPFSPRTVWIGLLLRVRGGWKSDRDSDGGVRPPEGRPRPGTTGTGPRGPPRRAGPRHPVPHPPDPVIKRRHPPPLRRVRYVRKKNSESGSSVDGGLLQKCVRFEEVVTKEQTAKTRDRFK